ncbi:MAG TPA: hypothetical protein VEQ11_06950, partial [Chloroflexota bacterium]|nr:hypothetical protein [Chloroflexota bacterium]
VSLAASVINGADLRAVGPRLWWTPGAVGAVVASRVYSLGAPWDQPSPLAPVDHVYALLLLAGVLWLGAALGLRLLRTLGVSGDLGLESLLFAFGLGLGGLAYLVLACGFLGLLHPWVLAVVIGVLAVLLRAELAELAAALPPLRSAWLDQRARLKQDPVFRLTLPLADLLVAMVALTALAPPTGYDALLYHLAGPKEFLQLGRLAPLPELQQANLPFTVELLYLLGLAAGSDELPGLLHVSFAVLTALATFSFGRRFFDVRIGWLAAAVFLSATALPIYAPMANIDYGWAYFDFLAVYGFVAWARGGHARWLTAAGLAAGLSLGSKYLGALTCAAIGAAIFIEASPLVRARPAKAAQLLARFVLPAALVAMPWYLKNWLWLGSPVWPLLAPDGAWDGGRYFASYMNVGRGGMDYLLLPIRIYQGGSAEYPAALPPFAFLLVPLYAFVRKHRLANYLLAFSALYFVVWSQGIQAARYLVPIFGALSLVVAYVLDQAIDSARLRGLGRVAVKWMVTLSMVSSVSMAVIGLSMGSPFAQLVGLESRGDYLSHVLPDYQAVRYLNEHRAEVGRVLVIGDARIFYLAPPAVVDQDLGVWNALVPDHEPWAIPAQLRRAGVSHILVSPGHLQWLRQFDPEQRVQQWSDTFERTRSAYSVLEYTNGIASVYRVVETVAERSEL